MDEKGLSVAEKVLAYNDANRTVAILCNHQKTVSNAQVEGLQILEDRLGTSRYVKSLRYVMSHYGWCYRGRATRVGL